MVSQKIVFVSGKGGVGKSVVAAALAHKYALGGRKTLLVELGEHSFYADYLGLPKVDYNPTPMDKNLDIAMWSGRECLKEYAKHLLKVEALYKLFFENRIMRTFIDVAPALPELSILGKITSGIRHVGPSMDYEVIVVDGYASGHMLSLLRAPQGMSEAIRVGPMAEQSRTMLEVLKNPIHCEYYLVALPEELPVVETRELFASIRQEVGISPRIICNRLIQPPVSTQEMQGISADSKIKTFATKLATLVERQESYLNQLRALDAEATPLAYFFESQPKKLLEQIARSL